MVSGRPPQLLAFLASSDRRTVADNVMYQAQHRVADVECKTHLRALLAGADQGAVKYSVEFDTLTKHRVADVECKTQRPALFTSAD